MKKCAAIMVCGGLMLAMTSTRVLADWNPGDPHKMHYPQLPDPTGWDVDVTTDFIFDDWMCGGSGPVSDIHFWASSKNDMGGLLERIIVEIWSDVPVGDPSNQLPYSHPGGKLWDYTFFPPDWTVRGPDSGGVQGWYSPEEGSFMPNNHLNYYQFNFQNIVNPFYQDEGTVYWLGIHMVPLSAQDAPWGWKTSLDHWNDDATYYLGGWNELMDPLNFMSLDMAFVITPEPATFAFLFMGGALLLKRRG